MGQTTPQRELSFLLYFIFDPQKFQLRFNSTGGVEILFIILFSKLQEYFSRGFNVIFWKKDHSLQNGHSIDLDLIL